MRLETFQFGQENQYNRGPDQQQSVTAMLPDFAHQQTAAVPARNIASGIAFSRPVADDHAANP